MKFLYWNTNSIDSLSQILDICKMEKPKIFFLSEITEELLENNEQLILRNNYEYFPNPGCLRVKMIIQSGLDIELGIQNKYYSHIILPNYNLNIISLHLPSQMFQHMDSLKSFIRDFREDIDKNIGNPVDEKIMVIGDFNVNPFEKPMIDFDGFLATNSTNSRKTITHLGKQKSLYYNPTWKLYFNNEFPGTKYFKRPSASSYDVIEHHFLDQVVISSKLYGEIISEDIKVINQSSNFTFYTSGSNTIQESDHLPLSYEIKF